MGDVVAGLGRAVWVVRHDSRKTSCLLERATVGVMENVLTVGEAESRRAPCIAQEGRRVSWTKDIIILYTEPVLSQEIRYCIESTLLDQLQYTHPIILPLSLNKP